MENWKTIPSHSDYEASDLGRIRRSSRLVIRKKNGNRIADSRILKPYPAKNGYLIVALGRKSKHNLVHRLVAETFLGVPPEGRNEVNHINLNKTDNRVKNLEWCSSAENKQHAHLNGAYDEARKVWSKRLLCVETGEIFSSSYAAAEWLNRISKQYSGLIKNMSANIRVAARNGRMRYGYHWKHVDE